MYDDVSHALRRQCCAATGGLHVILCLSSLAGKALALQRATESAHAVATLSRDLPLDTSCCMPFEANTEAKSSRLRALEGTATALRRLPPRAGRRRLLGGRLAELVA